MVIENDIELPVVEIAEEYGWVARKVRYVGRRNCLDRVFFGHGRCVWLEFKRPGAGLNPTQSKEFRRLKKTGYPDIHWCDSIEAALTILGIENA